MIEFLQRLAAKPRMYQGLSAELQLGYDAGCELRTCSSVRLFLNAAMLLGISPLNDFAFKKSFGTKEVREPLIGLLNAVLQPRPLIREIEIQNPFNYQDFQDDKLSILDVKAVDAARAMYDVEVQLRVAAGLEKRVAFYGCGCSRASCGREPATRNCCRSMRSGW